MRLTGLTAAALAMLCCAQAQASWHLGAGPVDVVDDEGSWVATVAWRTARTHPYEFMGGYIDGRNAHGVYTPAVFFASASRRLTWKHWFAQAGIAYASADNEVLSKHFQFQTGIGYDFGPLSVSIRHLSNAGTGGRNRGESFLLFDYALPAP